MRGKFLLFCLLLSLVNYSVAQNNSEENQLISVEVAGKWGYIDKTGKMVIKPQFDDAFNFEENDWARVKVNDKYGYIDKSGKMIIEPWFEEVASFSSNGLARVKIDGKWGYFAQTGSIIKESRILAPIHQASWLVPQCT